MPSSEATWTPERLIHYPAVQETAVSPDGNRVAYTIREPVLTEDESKFVTHLYLAAEGGEPLRLTFGQTSNSMPRWSPDGKYLAFLSDRAKGKRNIYVLRADGGEAWPLTAFERQVTRLAWSPDGTRLAFAMAPPETEEHKAAKKAKDDTIRWDVDHERAHLWIVDRVSGGEPPAQARDVTPCDDRHVVSLSWNDEGTAIAYAYQPTPSPDVWSETRLAVVSAREGEQKTHELGRVASWGPDIAVRGEWVACPVAVEPVSWTVNERVALFPLSGGEPRLLAPTPDGRPYIVGWSVDGERVLVLESSRVSSAVRELPIDGSDSVVLLDGDGYVSAVDTNGKGALSFVHEDVSDPNHVCLWRAGESTWRELANPVPTDWPADPVSRTEVLTWTSPDGLEIEGLVTYPLGYTPGDRYPMVVIVHGGPMGVYSRTYVAAASIYPVAAFAERGYVVLRANPRGSGGYGTTFRAANVRDWGGGDYGDIMAGIDALIARGIADPNRLGIMGWSYGGYMTSWAITQTTRFRAASVGAGVTDLVSFTGSTDIPSFLPSYLQAEFWDDLEVYTAHSALFHIKGASTPTLIQHGERDDRVPLGQGKELYNALKRQGVPVEMDIYPRQNHGPSEPRIVMDIMRRNLGWFERWL